MIPRVADSTLIMVFFNDEEKNENKIEKSFMFMWRSLNVGASLSCPLANEKKINKINKL